MTAPSPSSAPTPEPEAARSRPGGRPPPARLVVGRAVGALSIAVGIAAAGAFVAPGLVEQRTADRCVTVKGVAERQMRADLAIWPLRFVATAEDLAEARAKIDSDTAAIRGFLGARGLAGDAARVEPPSVVDRLVQAYQSGPMASRFMVDRGVTVRSADVEAVDAASRAVTPEMIAGATANARRGAERFAADTGARVGGIRTASQGLFRILARDDAPGLREARQITKTVRVVSTIQYVLTE